MRTFLIILIVLAVLIAAAGLWLFSSTPESAVPVRFPLSNANVALLRRVPASAEAFALIPSAALLHAKLLANPVTREPIATWSEEHELPRPWMLGGAHIVAWKSGKTTSYAVQLDALRALLVRAWLLVASNATVRWEGSTLIMNDPEPSAEKVALEDVLRLATRLPEGDIFVVQREGSRGAFPPIARPAVTSVRVTPAEILLVSRAASTDVAIERRIEPRYPRGAMLAASFAAPPRILGDFNRLLGARIDILVDDGGSVALYDIETGTLLPRPRGVLAIPADEAARGEMGDVRQAAELVGEVRDTGDQILVSFDRTSMGLYIKDTFVPASWPATRWAVRFDPARLVPVLERVSDNPALRFATPRIHRGARDLRRWMRALEQAEAVEAADSVASGVEELRVRVASK
ncbi:MAG TPA: hypothetical protein VEK57_05105 [Thermoanaerobaculia bacterium]|nr:hypothetical protein [Thermoanaerobaculia bacterium]